MEIKVSQSNTYPYYVNACGFFLWGKLCLLHSLKNVSCEFLLMGHNPLFEKHHLEIKEGKLFQDGEMG